MNWQKNVKFPKHFKPLPPGYRIVQLDSGHYLWCIGDTNIEAAISWDRYWVRRCAFAHFAKYPDGDKPVDGAR